ncbi:hypothetical protein DsansV1_C11g0106831 [Dioscorea sansibarensis]
MDFYVVLERPGYRVGHTKEDSMKWFHVGAILKQVTSKRYFLDCYWKTALLPPFSQTFLL